MDTVTYTQFQEQLEDCLDKVNRDHRPLLVTRHNAAPVVVMTLEDFQAYDTTFYLLASPNNATRLNQAIAELRAGKGQEQELLEPAE